MLKHCVKAQCSMPPCQNRRRRGKKRLALRTLALGNTGCCFRTLESGAKYSGVGNFTKFCVPCTCCNCLYNCTRNTIYKQTCVEKGQHAMCKACEQLHKEHCCIVALNLEREAQPVEAAAAASGMSREFNDFFHLSTNFLLTQNFCLIIGQLMFASKNFHSLSEHQWNFCQNLPRKLGSKVFSDYHFL